MRNAAFGRVLIMLVVGLVLCYGESFYRHVDIARGALAKRARYDQVAVQPRAFWNL
jgi:hypothetical protein